MCGVFRLIKCSDFYASVECWYFVFTLILFFIFFKQWNQKHDSDNYFKFFEVVIVYGKEIAVIGFRSFEFRF